LQAERIPDILDDMMKAVVIHTSSGVTMNTDDTKTDAGVPKLITLLTDFGGVDPFVGVMKGVIYGIDPDVTLIDLTHGIAAQDVMAGAFALLTAYRYFPPGTLHLAVVDPGVGTERRALAILTTRYLFVGPDNGLLSWAAVDDGIRYVVSITNGDYLLPHPSATFHGRDIFAPAAAHLSLGVHPDELGERIDDPLVLDFPKQRYEGTYRITGTVIYVDRFGNLITNVRLTGDELPSITTITLKDTAIKGISQTYREARPGEPLALVGSSGFVEIACNEASAAEVLGAGRGDEVIFDRED